MTVRNIKTREGYEFWDKLCAIPRYGFIHSADNSRILKAEGIGNWIDMHAAQEVVDAAQDEINELRSELDQLRRWEKEVRENSPLLIRLEAAENERDNLKAAFTEWLDKTEWVQKAISSASLPIRYLGMHRADALRAEIERLQAINYRQEQQIAALTTDPNGWQAGYNKGRQDGTKTRLSELEQERRINRELHEQLREQRDDYAVGAALQRAACELPEGFEIRVEVERDAGTTRLYDPNGDEIEGIEGDGLADEILEAISHAKGELPADE